MKAIFWRNIMVLALVLCMVSCEEESKGQPYTQTGDASYYARMFEGRKTASGTRYRKDSLTAAHRTLPMGTIVKITNIENDKEVVVEINDRGPYKKGRIIDLSRSAAREIALLEDGTVAVNLEVVEAAPGYSISDSVEVK